jgi:hypothetical protein
MTTTDDTSLDIISSDKVEGTAVYDRQAIRRSALRGN